MSSPFFGTSSTPAYHSGLSQNIFSTPPSPYPTVHYATGSELQATDLWQRIKFVKSQDANKNALLEDIGRAYETLQNNYKAMVAEKEHIEHALRTENTRLLNLLDKAPFVLVLIDGDDMTFHSDLLRQGQLGGRRAVKQLTHGINRFLDKRISSIQGPLRIVCRIYADLRGLTGTCLGSGMIADDQNLKDFMTGFTLESALFDFVDTGLGKDMAFGKIFAHLNLYLDSPQCRNLILGCAHNIECSKLLRGITDQALVSRISLLKGPPFAPAYFDLPFEKITIAGLFSGATDLSVAGAPPIMAMFQPMTPLLSRASASQPTAMADPQRQTLESSSDGSEIFHMSGILEGVKPADGTEKKILDVLDHTEFPALVKSKQPPSFADAVKACAPSPTLTFPIPVKQAGTSTPRRNKNGPPCWPVRFPKVIPRNEKGQRVDTFIYRYDRDAVNKVRDLRLCHAKFVRGDCHFGSGKCKNRHDYDPTAAELDAMRIITRLAPCQQGPVCDDYKCAYGHSCPAPKFKKATGSEKGMLCIYGRACRFSEEMHDIDSTIVMSTNA